jgi:uncharacterized membrane protein YdfJ with MMPL/SSD domain
MFARWGRFVYRWRWATLVVSVVLLGASVYGLMSGGSLGTGNSASGTLEAERAATLINNQLSTDKKGGSNFLLIFSSPDQLATDPEFQTELEIGRLGHALGHESSRIYGDGIGSPQEAVELEAAERHT